MLGSIIAAAFLGIIILTFAAAPRRVSVEGFYDGQNAGIQPGLWTLVLSQVTTWIFARSLMNVDFIFRRSFNIPRRRLKRYETSE